EIDELFAVGRDLVEVLEDVARLGARLILQTALEAEVTEFLGRERYARGDRTRAGSRNGYSDVTVKTTAGPVELARPKLRGALSPKPLVQDPPHQPDRTHLRRVAPPSQGHRAPLSERSCLSLVWAVLDRARRGWRGVRQTPANVRLLQQLRHDLFEPPTAGNDLEHKQVHDLP
ncbi:MAG: hypothetical protein GEV09_28335, partial [Pseudonocardiaceae bacterium]|nr:hypothetical protein [Pseudonocardiaceae bacterium]